MIKAFRYAQSFKKVEQIFNREHFNDKRRRDHRRKLQEIHDQNKNKLIYRRTTIAKNV